MTKTLTLALLLGVVAFGSANADPLVMTGSNLTQNNIGTSVADQTLSAIFNSTVANGAAGNTFTVAEVVSPNGYATFIGDSFLQQNIGNSYANQSATNVVGSSVANNAAGNAITFSGQ